MSTVWKITYEEILEGSRIEKEATDDSSENLIKAFSNMVSVGISAVQAMEAFSKALNNKPKTK